MVVIPHVIQTVGMATIELECSVGDATIDITYANFVL